MVTVLQIVKNYLPYLTSGADSAIEMFEYNTMVLLQKCLNKTDAQIDVALEATDYTPLERGLIGDLVTINMLVTKTIENTSGVNGSAAGNKYLKRAKAGSVETEFAIPDKNSTGSLAMTAEGLLDEIKKAALLKAGMLGCNLQAWLSDVPVESPPLPFLIVPYSDDCCY